METKTNKNKNLTNKFKKFGFVKFVGIPSVCIQDISLIGIEREELLVMAVLMDYCWGEKVKCHPSIKTIARRLGYKIDREGKCSTVRKIVNRLQDKGLLSVVVRPEGKTSFYDITQFLVRCGEVTEFLKTKGEIAEEVRSLVADSVRGAEWNKRASIVAKNISESVVSKVDIQSELGVQFRVFAMQLAAGIVGLDQTQRARLDAEMDSALADILGKYGDSEFRLRSAIEGRWLMGRAHLRAMVSRDHLVIIDALAREEWATHQPRISDVLSVYGTWQKWELGEWGAIQCKHPYLSLRNIRHKYFPFVPDEAALLDRQAAGSPNGVPA